ncbi:MAG: hypothetical protein IJ599_03710 [Alphaproteobacteria bacterium]|nr:hypothetical protein [Alphaproteobacteria bacterium]
MKNKYLRRHYAEIVQTTKSKQLQIIIFFKRDEKKHLICRAAVKPAGRSPKSKR